MNFKKRLFLYLVVMLPVSVTGMHIHETSFSAPGSTVAESGTPQSEKSNSGETIFEQKESRTSEPLSFTVERVQANPIIHRKMPGMIGEDNINGPSLIRVPDWIDNPLGKYYLYFGHHHGRYIRMAYADDLEGPWTIYEGGVFPVEASPAFEYYRPRDHVASPDVHIDHDEQMIRMYYHIPIPPVGLPGQGTYAAISHDGLNFRALNEFLGLSYMSVFKHNGWYYGIAKRPQDEGEIIYRSRYSLVGFERRRAPAAIPRMRHLALWKHNDILYVFFSRIGDAPEHIMVSYIKNLDDDWHDWEFSEPQTLLRPEKDYEGVNEPVVASTGGGEYNFVHRLQDPAIFEDDDGRLYLLYSTAGEWAIAIAELTYQ